MPMPVEINLDEVAMNPERVQIKYANKDVIIKMYSIPKPSLDKWISKMSKLPQFADGVLHPSHKIVLIELDTFEEFLRWLDQNRYKRAG